MSRFEKPVLFPVSLWSSFLGFLLPWSAQAYSGGPLVGFVQSVADFLTGTLGPPVFVLGLAIAAYGFFFGHREALQRSIYVIVGGAILFSIPSIVGFVQQTAH